MILPYKHGPTEISELLSDLSVSAGSTVGRSGATHDHLGRVIAYSRKDSYCCYHCLREYDQEERVEFLDHAKQCIFRLDHDGVNTLLLTSIKRGQHQKFRECISRFHILSHRERNVAYNRRPRQHHLPWRYGGSAFIYVRSGVPLGMLLIETRKMPVDANAGYFYYGPFESKIIVADFFVVAYIRRTGIGKTLFDAMLKHYNTPPRDLLYTYPSVSAVRFLKRWYNIKTMNILG
jgi:hypothetical protein